MSRVFVLVKIWVINFIEDVAKKNELYLWSSSLNRDEVIQKFRCS